MKQVGRALSHESALAHVTGSAKYVDELWLGRARVAHAWPVPSPHAHARVLEIASAEAERSPGFLTLLGAADVRGENDVGPLRHDEPLFPSVACFHGQPVVWVVAESEEQARLAAARVKIRYEPLPAIGSISAAISEQSFHTEIERLRSGDPDAALAAAPYTLSGEQFINGQEHFYLETQAALAYPDESGGVFVHSSTQHPTETQEVVARVLAVPRNQVVVQCLRMGGAFGGKETQANLWAAVAALGADKLKRPVRVRLTRSQDIGMTGKRHPFLGRFQVGFAGDGTLLALKLELFSDGGFSLDLSSAVLFRAMFHADNCYRVPHFEVLGRVCKTHRPSSTAFRGFGGPQGMLLIEDIIERVARSLRLAPELVRERNFYRAGDSTHYGQVVKDAERISELWRALKESSAFAARQRACERFNAAEPYRKRGIAITPVKFGISFTNSVLNQAGALVLIYTDGSVQLNHGGAEMGQGLHTKMLQIAADALGVPLQSIRVMPTRTDKVPNTSATAASSGSDLNGAAIREACATLQARLASVAARLLLAPESSVVFSDGEVYAAAAPERRLSFASVVNEAYLSRVSLSATGYYRTPNLHFDRASGTGKPFHYFAYGAAVSEVEVDGFTGQYALLRSDILQDVGDSLSPLVDRGQIEGGFIQGVGWLTTEELVWGDELAVLTRGASTYKLPTLAECPPQLNVTLLPRAAEAGVVHGSKAVGEPPLMLALSVREALRAAIAAFGDGDVTLLPCPATPEAVYFALERASESARQRERSNAAQ